MTSKADLIAAVANRLGEPQVNTKQFIDAIFGTIADSLAAGEEVKIAGFGTFGVRKMRERQGRNPRSGEVITVPARNKATFRPAKELKGRI